MKTKFLKAFLVCHLLIVLVGSGLIKYNSSFLDAFIVHYSCWTGGGFGYSFFSPDVGDQTVAKAFTLTRNNEMKIDAFGTGETLFNSRLSAVIHTLRSDNAYELLARIIASLVLSEYPGSRVTYISIGDYKPSTIIQSSKGINACKFREVYYGTYFY